MENKEFNKIYKEYYSLVKKLARNISSNQEDIEDMMIVGMMKLNDLIDTYDGDIAKMSTYVYKRISGAMKDMMKKEGVRKRKKVTIVSISDVDQILLLTPSDEQNILDEGESSHLKKKLENILNQKELEIIKMVYWRGMDGKEVAEKIGMSEGRFSQIHKEIINKIRENINGSII